MVLLKAETQLLREEVASYIYIPIWYYLKKYVKSDGNIGRKIYIPIWYYLKSEENCSKGNNSLFTFQYGTT